MGKTLAARLFPSTLFANADIGICEFFSVLFVQLDATDQPRKVPATQRARCQPPKA
jgi:hypothetical protein